ncbi:MAG: hypothetical protein JNK79_09185 [Chitinophagaceae bacterium]|nr:hypothetical protein [Chitinophagaceae bacterium]
MNRFVKFILVTGLIAGTLDIIGAFILQYFRSGKISITLLNYIAGGWLGVEKAMKGGTGAALLGLLSHYFIATCFVTFFFLLYPRIKILRFNAIVIGLLYGLFIDTVMSRIVLPLSALNTHPDFNLTRFLTNSLVVGIAVGVPAAIASRKYYTPRALSSAPINRK